MKALSSIAISGVVAIAGMLSACSPSGPRTIDLPVISLANTSIIDIVKVELTDSNTVLHVNAHYSPGQWIKITSDSYLSADGKNYALTESDGIEPDAEFYMPESGEVDFRLMFEPLPFSTRTFDFIEGNEPGAFRLIGVDISGEPVPSYPAEFPKELKKEPADGPVPDPVFEIGETTVRVHIRPYNAEIFPSMVMYVNSIDGTQEEYQINLDSIGDGSVTFDQYGIAKASITSSNMGYGRYTLFPGETIDCYIDGRRSGARAMMNREGVNVIYDNAHTGHYSDLDRNMGLHHGTYYGFYLYTGDFADYHMTGDEYKAMVKRLYEEYSDSIAKEDVPEMVKEMKMLMLQNDVLETIGESRYFLEHNYRHVHNMWNRRDAVPADSIKGSLTDEDYAEVTRWFDTSNPKLLLADTKGITSLDWNDKGAEGDLSKSLRLYSGYSSEARNGQLTTEEIDSLKTLSNPFFAAACDSINQRTMRKLAAVRGNAVVTPTPDVAPDKLFDAIVAPHKGKVVVIDLWNTWCGPCRSALAATEPLKDGELADDDIVWIYIADDSSNEVKYLSMIPSIRGIHYKLNDEQKKAVYSRFNVDGIPYYILVDRSGKAEGRPDLRNHATYREAIKTNL